MFGVDQLAPDRILESLFPLTPLNWFARSYFILYIMFPLLNRFIFHVSRRTLGCVILVLTMYFYVVPTVLGGTRGGYGNSTFMFADMYMIGAYIRQYGNERLARQLKIAGVLGLIVFWLPPSCSLTIWGSVILFIGSKAMCCRVRKAEKMYLP